MRSSLLVLPLSLVVACTDAPSTNVDATTVDVSQDASDTGAVDTARDALPEASAASCVVPSVRLGDAMEARALAQSPARCGQAAHTWLNDPELGRVTGTGAHANYTAAVLQALATAGNINLPVPLSRDVTVDQISYVTQDRGRRVEATTLVAYPRNLPTRADFEVLLVLHGTSGFNDACAPSTSTDARALGAALASTGYVVVAPDYIGLRAFGGSTGFPHPYLVGTATAMASLDAVRAGLRHIAAQSPDVCARPRYVAFGGSQGGHAALWVDRIGRWYAPELELVGTVATVPPADLIAEADRALQMTVPATANMAAFFTVTAPWYGLEGRLGEVFNAPWAADLPRLLATSCSPDVRSLTREALFTPTLLAAGASTSGIRGLDPWGCLAAENSLLATSVPRAGSTTQGYGILWVLGEQDQLVNTPIERASFQTLCRAGYRMQYLECLGATHTRATTWALPEILDFARARFDGRPLDAAATCVVNVATRCRATPAGM